MKILYLINSYADGGAEHGLATLVENGFFQGHDLSVLALCKGTGWACERLRAALGRTRVGYLYEDEDVGNAVLARAIPRLVGALMDRRPDVLFLSLPQANFAGRLAALAFPAMRVVAFEHTVDYRRRSAGLLMRLTAGRVNAVFYDAPETWASIRRAYGAGWSGPALYVPLTVLRCREDEPCRPGRGEPDGGVLRILTTGRLIAQKNQENLIRAIRLVVDRGHRVVLDIAGEGEERGRLQTVIHELGLERHVTLLGFIRDCAPLRRSSDIYVQVSVREGLCIAVLEAMAEGMLVVATDVGGIRDYGVDGENMIKAAGTEPPAIADALIRAIDGLKDSGRIRGNALDTIQHQFTEAAITGAWSTAQSALCMR
ncbi:glycosyltransferase involved in cell wall biosynthesis [Azospirillum agricola]|uniref:glycosyltransferase n=1 Tax=Azospirillum agricola TaxID=1720247 RepID=UPI001AE57B0B|nr:glycosyltransferase [Azospirillum agricola]MBP2227759.1 glycosyltransferase involved in cell wall biosynthesis [Azospirillum agricola]